MLRKYPTFLMKRKDILLTLHQIQQKESGMNSSNFILLETNHVPIWTDLFIFIKVKKESH